MQPKELKEILPKFSIKGLPINFSQKFELCGLKLEQKLISCHEPKQILAEITTFAPEQGWLCFQSEVNCFHQGEAIPTSSGLLLYGEVSKPKDKESLHIREDGQGGWIITHFIEIDGEEYLKEKQKFLGEGKGLTPENLYYNVYWQYHEEYGYHQYAARFLGF